MLQKQGNSFAVAQLSACIIVLVSVARYLDFLVIRLAPQLYNRVRLLGCVAEALLSQISLLGLSGVWIISCLARRYDADGFSECTHATQMMGDHRQKPQGSLSGVSVGLWR